MFLKGEWVKVYKDVPDTGVFAGEVYEVKGTFAVLGTSYTKLAGVEHEVASDILQHAHEGHVYTALKKYSEWRGRQHKDDS